MRLKLILISLITFSSITAFSQVTVEMKRIDGVLQVPCKVNGIPMNFIFDTGASDVSISITEAKFLVKQGLLSKDDFVGKVNYQIANGDIVEGMQVYLKTIDIGGITLRNIRASIMKQENSPLLFGQSAITKLGEYSISGNNLIIENGNSKHDSEPKKSQVLKQDEIESAIAYLNQFLNDETWASKINGGFTYNNMFKSLAFKSKLVVKNELTIEKEFILNFDNIKYIKEVVHKANKTENVNFIAYEFNLNNDIYYKNYTKQKGDVIPDYKNSKVNKVSVDFHRSLTEQDLTNIQSAVRNIFVDIPIKTKSL